MDPQTIIIAGSVLSSVLAMGGIIWKFSTYLAHSFSDIKDLINLKIDKVMNKLDYHEQHDDKRFSDVNNALWELRIQNALLSKGVFLDQETAKATKPRAGHEETTSRG